jgi:hypothetical protein
MAESVAGESLVLLPESEARTRLGARARSFRVLRPPYPALGCGALRVLRVAFADDGDADLIAGYESYVRLDASAGAR